MQIEKKIKPKRVKAQVLINQAKELDLYDLPPITLWAIGSKMRRTFNTGVPDIADMVTDYLARYDAKYILALKRGMGANSTYYHLAPSLEIYAVIEVKLRGIFCSVYNPVNFPVEMRFHTPNEGHIIKIVELVNMLWGGSMLGNINYKYFKKKFKVSPEQIRQAWEKWSNLKDSMGAIQQDLQKFLEGLK